MRTHLSICFGGGAAWNLSGIFFGGRYDTMHSSFKVAPRRTWAGLNSSLSKLHLGTHGRAMLLGIIVFDSVYHHPAWDSPRILCLGGGETPPTLSTSYSSLLPRCCGYNPKVGYWFWRPTPTAATIYTPRHPTPLVIRL